jgi:hypothetical protein
LEEHYINLNAPAPPDSAADTATFFQTYWASWRGPLETPRAPGGAAGKAAIADLLSPAAAALATAAAAADVDPQSKAADALAAAAGSIIEFAANLLVRCMGDLGGTDFSPACDTLLAGETLLTDLLASFPPQAPPMQLATGWMRLACRVSAGLRQFVQVAYTTPNKDAWELAHSLISAGDGHWGHCTLVPQSRIAVGVPGVPRAHTSSRVPHFSVPW